MAPSNRIKAAFKAMRDIGIPEDKTKPALKKLLKLFDKKWELIEEENYRLLADTIFEDEDTAAAEKEQNKKPGNVDQGEVFKEAAQSQDEPQDEPERPLKRLRLKYQNQAAPSHNQHGSTAAPLVLKTPKPEPGEPEASPNQLAQSAIGSPQPLVLRNKGKQPISHETSQRDLRPRPERASKALQIKEPTGGPAVTPKPKQPNLALIKPKDEPFTDDMLSLEPLAVVLPDQMLQEVPSNDNNPGCKQTECLSQAAVSNSRNPVRSQVGKGSGASRLDRVRSGASKSSNGVDKGQATLTLSRADEDHIENADVSKRIPLIDIATSSLGEVKLFLSCNSSLQGKEFSFPGLQEVMKKVDDVCLKKFKIMDAEFSVMKVMKDFCDHVGELGTNAVNQDRCNQQDDVVIESNGNCLPQSNGSLSVECSDNVAATIDMTNITDASNPSSVPKSLAVCEESDQIAADDNCAEKDSSVVDMDVNSLVLVHPQQLNNNMLILHDSSDIARGIERVVVSLEKSKGHSLPSFHYIPHNVISHTADLYFCIAQVGDKDSCPSCCGDCFAMSPYCQCAQRNGGESSYTPDGLVREEFLDMCIALVRNPKKDSFVYCKECPLERLKNEGILDPCKGHLKHKFIKECWVKCGCSKNCGNRVVQRGISCNLQVFWTPEGKGWGLRTLEDLPKGSFVCEYVGEILTCTELYERNMKRSNDNHSYTVLLDSEWATISLLETEILCLDSTYYGNVARFINHRCSDANLIEIPVEVETPNHHYYHVALFATRNISAFEELTWDYGVDFDDAESHYKAFSCLCGSSFCRNMKRSNRSRSTLTIQ